MSYKDKVKKALELIDSSLNGCSTEYYENLIQEIREVLEDDEIKDITLFDLVKGKYDNDVFATTEDEGTELIVYPFDDVVQVVLRKYTRQYNSYSGDWSVIAEFPHIKTLKQFEELYKALTGKELGDD